MAVAGSSVSAIAEQGHVTTARPSIPRTRHGDHPDPTHALLPSCLPLISLTQQPVRTRVDIGSAFGLRRVGPEPGPA